MMIIYSRNWRLNTWFGAKRISSFAFSRGERYWVVAPVLLSLSDFLKINTTL